MLVLKLDQRMQHARPAMSHVDGTESVVGLGFFLLLFLCNWGISDIRTKPSSVF